MRRGVTSVGPQRDDLFMSIQGLAARTQASQGEQRSLALALRLGGHALVNGPTELEPSVVARRRVLRARPQPECGPGVVPARRPDAADLGRAGPGRPAGCSTRVQSATASCTRRPALRARDGTQCCSLNDVAYLALGWPPMGSYGDRGGHAGHGEGVRRTAGGDSASPRPVVASLAEATRIMGAGGGAGAGGECKRTGQRW